jgi:chromosome partitioning protein
MPAKVIAIANQKGGVGKTTTSVNLAACLAQHGFPTLLVDCDPQANATSAVGIPKTEGVSIFDALTGEASLQDRVRETAFPKLFILPAERNLASAEIAIARMDDYLQRLQFAMVPLKNCGLFEFILIDCPPSVGILMMNAIAAADTVLIPIQCEFFSLEGLGSMLQTIEQIKSSGANPGLELEGIVMTMYDPRTNLSQQVMEEVRKHFGDKVYQTPIPRSVRVSEAPSHGRPIIHYDRNNAGCLAYETICQEFLHRQARRIQFVNGHTKSEQPVAAPAPAPVPEAQAAEPEVLLTPPEPIQVQSPPQQ